MVLGETVRMETRMPLVAALEEEEAAADQMVSVVEAEDLDQDVREEEIQEIGGRWVLLKKQSK